MDAVQPFHPWIALAMAAFVFAALQLRRRAPIDWLFLCALVVVTITGVIDAKEAMAGFANPAVLTIAGLLAVTAGLRGTGAIDWMGHRLLGSSRTEASALRRLSVTLVAASAFILNVALVAMAMPVVVDWCRRRHISPSRLLIPVSYLAILGGVCTLIGTSTTLVVNGMLKSEYQHRAEMAQHYAAANPGEDQQIARMERFADGVRPMGLFEIGYVGFPCALVGIGVLILVGRRLLPNRTDMLEKLDEQRREYLAEILVQPECRLIGRTVEQAGLRHLPGLFLIEIDRNGQIITPVSPEDLIRAGDRLVFSGVVSTIVDLQRIPGLVPAADSTYEVEPAARQQRHLTEVVLSRTSPLIGTTVKEANFRRRYDAAVVAVHRNGVRVTNKIGNIELEVGDTLLLQTRGHFVRTYRNSRDFYLVSSVEGAEVGRHDRALVAGGLMLLLVVWLSMTSWLEAGNLWSSVASPAVAALAVVALMILTRCMRVSEARQAIDLQVIVTIAAAIGLGLALTKSGAAKMVADALVQAVGDHPYLLLIMLYLLTMVFTEIISNVAVATMLFSFAVAVAASGGYNPRPFVMAVALAASLSFLTPVGYHTNLLVMGPGGYQPRDYLRVGLPMAVAVAAAALLLIPQVWPLVLPE
jgi:di/tricarboxylate transporter